MSLNFKTLSSAKRAALLTSAVGFGLFAGITSASAQTITVWSGYPELAPYYEHVAQGMKATHPNLTVNVEAIALREHEKRIALGLTSNANGTLVIEMSTSTGARYVENELLPEAPADVTAFVQDDANFSDFLESTASYNGKVYGVPLYRGQGALFYNTEMFAAAGLDSAPKTMAEYTDYATKLTQRDANGNPTVSGWSLRLSGGGQGITEKFWLVLHNHGGKLLEQNADGTWKAAYANEAGVAALKQYLENIYTHKNVSIEMPSDAEAFEREQTAMFIRESWVIGDIASKAPDLKYATAPLPLGSISLPVNLYVSTEGTPESQAAWEFNLAANEPDNLVWLLDNVGWLPNRSGVDFSSVIAAKPAFEAFVNTPENYEFFTPPSISPIEEVQTRLSAFLVEAFADASLATDDAKIADFLKRAADETNSILKREGIYGE